MHRDVGTGAHGDADLRLRQGRRIVDPVAGHCDDPALLLKAPDHRGLLIRKHFGGDVVEAELATHSLGGGPAVAGKHDRAHPVATQRHQRADGALLDRIGDGKEAGRPAVDRDQHDALAVLPELLGASG